MPKLMGYSKTVLKGIFFLLIEFIFSGLNNFLSLFNSVYLIVQRDFVVLFPYMHIRTLIKLTPSITLSYSPFPFQNNFNGFYYSVFIHSYEVH
jgi:hypothetical protein